MCESYCHTRIWAISVFLPPRAFFSLNCDALTMMMCDALASCYPIKKWWICSQKRWRWTPRQLTASFSTQKTVLPRILWRVSWRNRPFRNVPFGLCKAKHVVFWSKFEALCSHDGRDACGGRDDASPYLKDQVGLPPPFDKDLDSRQTCLQRHSFWLEKTSSFSGALQTIV